MTFVYFFLAPLGESADIVPDIRYIRNTTVPLLQLTGDFFQIHDGIYATAATQNQTNTNFGAYGVDEGPNVEFSDKIYFLFGDTYGSYPGSGGLAGKSVWDNAPADLFLDGMGYIPNADLSGCGYISQVDPLVAGGQSNPNVPFTGCPSLSFFQNSSHGATQPIFARNSVSGLGAGQDLNGSHTPTGAFALNGFLYEFYTVESLKCGNETYHTDVILAKSTSLETSWTPTSPPTFTKLYDASSISIPACVSVPADDSTSPGKFMDAAPVVLDHATIASLNATSGLPPALQNAAHVVFIFGSSWRFRLSNLYLAAAADSGIEGGVANWWYYSGNSSWTQTESNAATLLTDWAGAGKPSIGEHSVRWVSALNRFVLFYGQNNTSGFVFRTAQTPWGPWTQETNFFPNQGTGTWADKILSNTGNPIVSGLPPLYNPGSAVATVGVNAGPYGAYLLDQFKQNSDNSVTLFFNMSTGTPYNVFLAEMTLTPLAPTIPNQPQNQPAINSVRVYPNPWRSDQDSGIGVNFDHLGAGSIIKLFTISGHWVQTLQASGGSAQWNLTTHGGAPVSSGIYLYLVTDSQENKARGLFTIIR